MPQKGRTKNGDPYVEVCVLSCFCRVFTVKVLESGRKMVGPIVRFLPLVVIGILSTCAGGAGHITIAHRVVHHTAIFIPGALKNQCR